MIKYLFFILVFAVSCDLSSKVFSVYDEGFKKHRGHEFIEKVAENESTLKIYGK